MLSNKGKVDGPNRTEQASQLLSLIKKNDTRKWKHFLQLQVLHNVRGRKKAEIKKRRRKKEKKKND